MRNLPHPRENINLKKYLIDVIAWHGYVRFLGLPSYQNNQDVPLEDLYVPHTLSSSYLSPDTDPEKWITVDPVNQLLKSKRLVVLGDPGSGKSTLVNWLAWYLSSGFSKRLPGELSKLLPIPLVIRDISMNGINSFDGLLDDFLSRPVAKEIYMHKEILYEYLNAGQVLLLVDGLDEIGIEGRKRIKDLLIEAHELYPEIFSLCTSRVVGYEDVPFQKPIEKKNIVSLVNKSIDEVEKIDMKHLVDGARLNPELFYMTPFSDAQIAMFALHWYREQGGPDLSAQLLRDDFILAIRSNESTLRLARTPNLLTMMALIYRVRVRLPNGRALLYEDIAQAYLESIDTARKIKDEFSWLSKKRWLARVGFEMQLRRVSRNSEEGATQELLIQRADILHWVNDAIYLSGEKAPDGYAEKYLDWIARRSGLLLPRGEGLFAFLHLSFQEYFAALFIKEQMEYPGWFSMVMDDSDEDVDKRVSAETVGYWADEPMWQQTCMFLFELCAQKPGWPRQLVSTFFPEGWGNADSVGMVKKVNTNVELDRIRVIQRGQFCIQILNNPHGGLASSLRTTLMEQLKELIWSEQVWLGVSRMETTYGATSLLSQVLTSSLLKNYGLKLIENMPRECNSLFLSKLDKNEEYEVLRIIKSINYLKNFSIGNDTKGFLKGLTCLENLNKLSLSVSDQEDISAMSICRNLKDLSTGGRFSDIESLGNLKKLEHLVLFDVSSVTSFEPISRLNKLRNLTLVGNPVPDKLIALQKLPKLEVLMILSFHEPRFDAKSISNFSNLFLLSIYGAKLSNFLSFAGMKKLRYLTVTDSDLVDISGINSLEILTELDLSSTDVEDISSISDLRNLTGISLNHTKVVDLSPLSNLSNLRSLSINNTPVKDLTPLRHLHNLRKLSIVGVNANGIDTLSLSQGLAINGP